MSVFRISHLRPWNSETFSFPPPDPSPRLLDWFPTLRISILSIADAPAKLAGGPSHVLHLGRPPPGAFLTPGTARFGMGGRKR